MCVQNRRGLLFSLLSYFVLYKSGKKRFFSLLIDTSTLIKFEKISNRPITKFYNNDNINVITAELRINSPIKVNKVLKTKC